MFSKLCSPNQVRGGGGHRAHGSLLLVSDVQAELREVSAEVETVEQQIQNLMELQQQLLDRKRKLEQMVRAQEKAASASAAKLPDRWDATGV